MQMVGVCTTESQGITLLQVHLASSEIHKRMQSSVILFLKHQGPLV